MKLAISNIAWNSSENSSVIEVLNEFSVDSIEVALSIFFKDLFDVSDFEIEEVKQYWLLNNIKIVAVQALLFGKPELLVFDKKGQKQIVEYLDRVMYISSKLGASKLVFGSPKNRKITGLSRVEAMQMATDFFSTLAELAGKHSVVLCIEPNAIQYDCNFITNTQEAFEFVELVSHEGFRLHLDTGVMQLNNEDIKESIELALPYLSHFHISEPFLDRIINNTVNHSTISKTLLSVHYDEYISIEMKKHNEENNIDNIRECLKFVKEIYFNNNRNN